MSHGDIAQLVRAPALQAGGPGFESLYLHQIEMVIHLSFQSGETTRTREPIVHYIWGRTGVSLDYSTNFMKRSHNMGD